MGRKRSIKSRLLGLMLALVLVFGCTGVVQAEDEVRQSITVTLRYEGVGETYIYPETVTLTNPERTYEEEGITGSAIAEAAYFTPLDVMIQYAKDRGETPSDAIGIGSWGTVGNFFGKVGAQESLMFAVNNQIGDKGSDQFAIQDGDQIVLYKYPDQYAYFSQEYCEVQAGEGFEIQVNAYAYDDNWNQILANPQNADMMLLHADGSLADDSKYHAGKTDVSGTARLIIYEEGDYILTAQDADGPGIFCRPYARVKVSGSLALTDEEKVAAARESLMIGDTSAVTKDLSLPSVWDHQTIVTWSSNDRTLVEDNGSIHRPVGEDGSAVLTATIRSGEAMARKEFNVTVKGCSLDLKSLSVSPGALNYDPEKFTYTIYVEEAVTDMEVTASTEDEAQGMTLSIASETFDAAAANEKSAKVPLTGEVTEIPVTVAMGEKSVVTMITVKKAKNPGEPLPELPADWGQYLGVASNNAVVSAGSATADGKLKWESYSNAPGSWGSYAGTPILVNGYLYAARNDCLEMIDLTDGHTVTSVKLASGLGFYSYITYGDGKIFVPLGDGSIQCFHAATLESLFLTERPSLDGVSTLQAVSAIHYANGMIYVGYTNGAWTDDALQGFFAAYDTVDIDRDRKDEVVAPAWTYGSASHYGAGSVSVGNYLIFGGDNEKMVSVDARTGKEAGSYKAAGKVRCLPVYADGYIWVTTQNGKVYKLELGENGALSLAASADLPAASNASPVVSGGKVYVTGGTFAGGFVAVYDSNLKKLASVPTDGQCNTPTLTTAYDDVYLYFTQNCKPGGVYAAKITGNNKITVQSLYTPVHENYSMSKVLVGQDGMLYFTNDDGYIYAVDDKGGSENGGSGDPEKDPSEGGKDPSGEGDKTPPVPPVSGKPEDERLPDASGFAPKKMVMRTAAKKTEEKAADAGIEEAIEKAASDGKQTLTVKNVPDTVAASVFAKLSAHPDLRLVFDCGTYTVSIRGKDVKNPQASLCTKLEEKDSMLSEEDSRKLGNYQQLVLDQDGPLPGVITIVYQIPQKLKDTKELYLYANRDLSHARDVTLRNQYAMFTLEEPGAYVLSDTQTGKREPAALTALADTGTKTGDSQETGNQTQRKFPVWGWFLLCAAGGLMLGAGGTWIVTARRKKEDVWVSE